MIKLIVCYSFVVVWQQCLSVASTRTSPRQPTETSTRSSSQRIFWSTISTTAERHRCYFPLLAPSCCKPYQTLQSRRRSTHSYDELIQLLRQHYRKKTTQMASRVKFNNLRQLDSQTIDEFDAILRRESVDCRFGTQLDDRLKDQFVAGISNDSIRKKLLDMESKPLADLVKRARELEIVDRDLRQLNQPLTSSAHSSEDRSSRIEKHRSPFGATFRSSMGTPAPSAERSTTKSFTSNSSRLCNGCGGPFHPRKECRFWNQNCHKWKARPLCSSLPKFGQRINGRCRRYKGQIEQKPAQ